MTPYYEQDGKQNSGRFQKGKPQGPQSVTHRQALSDALKRSWARGRGGLGFGKGSGSVRPIGTKSINRQGYVLVKVDQKRRRLEHVLVMEAIIGRYIVRGEVVHHINGNRQDNSPVNLFLCRSLAHHNEVHRSQDHALRALLSAGKVVFRDGVYEAVL